MLPCPSISKAAWKMLYHFLKSHAAARERAKHATTGEGLMLANGGGGGGGHNEPAGPRDGHGGALLVVGHDVDVDADRRSLWQARAGATPLVPAKHETSTGTRPTQGCRSVRCRARRLVLSASLTDTGLAPSHTVLTPARTRLSTASS